VSTSTTFVYEFDLRKAKKDIIIRIYSKESVSDEKVGFAELNYRRGIGGELHWGRRGKVSATTLIEGGINLVFAACSPREDRMSGGRGGKSVLARASRGGGGGEGGLQRTSSREGPVEMSQAASSRIKTPAMASYRGRCRGTGTKKEFEVPTTSRVWRLRKCTSSASGSGELGVFMSHFIPRRYKNLKKKQQKLCLDGGKTLGWCLEEN